MRLTARGLQFSTLVDVSYANLPWTADVPCTPTSHALCRENEGLVYFPDDVVDTPYDLSLIPVNSVLAQFPHGTCHGTTGRRISVGDTQYEVSLCDLLSANMDILLDTSRDRLRWRVDSTNTIEYIFVGVVCVYFMSCISANVVRVSGHVKFRITRIEIAVLLIAVAYVTVNLFFNAFGSWFGGLRFLLTTEDYILSIILWVYVICETCVIAGPMFMGRRDSASVISGVSVYTALIMLMTLRVHYTFDNPYMQVLVIMFGTRSFLKVFNIGLPLDLCHVVVAFDVACFCAQLALAVGPAATDAVNAVLDQVTVATISMLLATAIVIKPFT